MLVTLLYDVGVVCLHVLLALTVRFHVQRTLLQHRLLRLLGGPKGATKEAAGARWRTAERIYLAAEAMLMVYYATGGGTWPLTPVECAIARSMWLVQWRKLYSSPRYGVGELPLLVAMVATCVELFSPLFPAPRFAGGGEWGMWPAVVANVALFIF